jgi:hypothetical protein
MAISKDKRRVTVSLTAANVDRFQELCRFFHMPSSTMSNACDDAIRSISDVFQMAKDNGKLSIEDLFKIMGQQIQLISAEEKEVKSEPKQKRDSVPHAQKHA